MCERLLPIILILYLDDEIAKVVNIIHLRFYFKIYGEILPKPHKERKGFD